MSVAPVVRTLATQTVTGVAVLIPAYNPPPELADLVQALADAGFASIVVVDDGSEPRCAATFEQLTAIEGVVVLRHPVNQGKGAALKSGLGYIHRELPHVVSVVTADADSQHTVEGICEVAAEAAAHPAVVVLGTRTFDGEVPLRSRIGNAATAALVQLFCGLPVRDTQTGLRAIPRAAIPRIVQIKFQRYDFEMEELLVCRKEGLAVREVPIETIYVDNNSASHFNPLVDSIKIYLVLLRYVFTSLVTSTVDFAVFIAATRMLPGVMAATYLARAAAVGVNYRMVRSLVFRSSARVLYTLPKYLSLVALSGFISGTIVTYCVTTYGLNIVASKIVAELTLYLANFLIQKNLIFGLKERA